MENLIGKLTASLIEKESSPPESLIDKINQNVHPPEEVTEDEVFVRAMYIVSDRVNSYGGRFPADEHDHLIEKLIDCPVLVGHRKDSLPIARTFYAEKERRDEDNWIKVYFYWLKNSTRGNDLRENIDGGIYKECSISFIFNFPECSVCGSDIRDCEHRPLATYKAEDGQDKQVCFNYRQIDKVLEASLVYRGAMPDTSITRELFHPIKEMQPKVPVKVSIVQSSRFRIWDLSVLDDHRQYSLMPAYEALSIVLVRKNKINRFFWPDRTTVDFMAVKNCVKRLTLPDGEYALDCRLIGYRGKERQSTSALMKFLDGKKSPVRRVEIKVCDLISTADENSGLRTGRERRLELLSLFKNNTELLIPAELVNGDCLTSSVNRYSTRFGLEIHEADSSRRFLFTHRKQASFIVTGKSDDKYITKYQVAVLVDGVRQTLDESIALKPEYKVGDVIEVEQLSFGQVGERIKIRQPRIVDSCGRFQQIDDVSLLFDRDNTHDSKQRYNVYSVGDGHVVWQLSENGTGEYQRWLLKNYSEKLLAVGRGFVAESIIEETDRSVLLGTGLVVRQEVKRDAIVYECQGYFDGRFVIKPVQLNNRRQSLFCRFESKSGMER